MKISFRNKDGAEKPEKQKRLTVEEREKLAPYIRERRLEAKDREERRKTKLKEEREQAHEEWLRKNSPTAYETYILAGVGIAPAKAADPKKELLETLEFVDRIENRRGRRSRREKDDDNGTLDAVREIADTLVNSDLGKGLAGAFAQQQAQTRAITVQPEPQQEAPVPRPNANQQTIDELVGVITNLVDRPGQGLIPPAEAAEKLKGLAELDPNMLRMAPSSLVVKQLGRDLSVDQRLLLHGMVRGIVSDLLQEEPTPQAMANWIIDQNNVKSPHLRRLWLWFRDGEATRVPWLADVTRALQGGRFAATAGPVEGI